MNARKPKQINTDPSRDTLNHSRDLLLALSRVTQVIQKARTAGDFYQVVGREIKSLGGEVTLLMMNDDNRSLTAVYTSYAPSLLRRIEKLTGKPVFGYQLDFPPNSVYARNLAAGRTEYFHWTAELIGEALPKSIRPLAGQFIKILKFDDSILAPLLVDEETLGLMLVSGSFVNENDVAVMESFAGQIAGGLRNVRLLQKLQDELAARRQAETDLQISQATFEGIFHSLTEAVYILSESGVFIRVNHGAEIMYGYAAEYFVGRTPEFLSAPAKNDLARVVEFIHEAYLGRTVEFEFWGLRKDGSIFPKDVRLSPGIYFGEKVVLAVGRDVTERKKNEEALQKSEAQYRLLADHTTDTIWLVDMNLKTLYISPSVEKIRGFTLEQIQELPLDRNLTPESFQLATELIANELSRVQADPSYSPVKTVELEFLNHDGSIYSTETKLSVIRDEDGNPVSILGESRDIADRKRIEKALFESERYYRALIENAPDGILVVNLDGTIRYESPAVARVLGYAPKSLIGTSAFDLICPDDLGRIADAFMEGLDTPRFIHRGEYRLRHSSGEWRDFEIVSHYLMDDPVINGIIINGHDITELKRINAALRESERKFHSIISESADGVILSDEMGRIIEFNDAIEKIIGRKRENVLGLFLWDLQFQIMPKQARTDETYARVKASIQKALETGEASFLYKIVEAPFEYSDGTVHFIQQRVFPVQTDKGWRLGSVSRDITEHKQTQDALAASEAELRALFASMQDAVLVIDRDGVYRDIAPTNPDRFYISPEDVIGKNMTDLFPAEQVEKFLQVMQRVLERQQTQHIEYQLFVNGHSPWFEASVSPMDTNRTLWVARDITERKDIEARLHLQSAALEAVANTVIITNHDGIIQWANSAFTSLTGFSSTEAIGKKPKELLKSGKQSPQFYAELWDTILSGRTWHNELVNRRKDDSLYYEEMTITPLRNFEGEISHFIAIKQDITERKQAEEALIRSEQAYRALFENMPIGLYRTSMNGHILDANQALVHMFGYPDRPSLIKMKTEDLYVSPASNIGFKEGSVEKDGHFTFEVEFRRYDQQTFWAEDNFHIVSDDAGAPLYYEGSLIDITNRKNAEEELLRATQSLEAAHRELQQTLANEQMLARTDGLTGLYNRRYFHELAAREFIAAIRYQRPLTIMLFDLDGLKQINDTFGHELGDTFLMQVAEIASGQVRNVDVLARYGGDEFIILFPETNAHDAYLIAERFRTTIESVKVATGGDPLSATISAGIAEIDHAHLNKSVEDTIRFADKALYKAKQKGKNCIEIYAPGSNED
ncbi:MAG: PAS domain S-box protein [Chloroflexi bacterium]|nr:PAS domain S-box protein [Chloroflexota bacterium]